MLSSDSNSLKVIQLLATKFLPEDSLYSTTVVDTFDILPPFQKDGFNLLKIAKNDSWKKAFRTRYGLYQYNVMPLGLLNASFLFQAMINEVLLDLLDQGVIVCNDAILIYTESMRQHLILARRYCCG
jgi:hypothetical protein